MDAMVAPGGWWVEQIQLYASPSWSARSFLRVQDVPCFVAYLPERRRGRPARRPGPARAGNSGDAPVVIDLGLIFVVIVLIVLAITADR